MSVELLEGNQVKITMVADYNKFMECVNQAYQREKGKFNLQGFRRGRAPRVMIENFYGKEIFHEDAVNLLLQELYPAAIEENKLDVVSRPEIDVKTIKENEDITLYATVTVKPEVKVSDYMGVEIEKVKTEASDEDVDNKINGEREKNARIVEITDRAIVDGDITNINFEGFCDGVAFDGGKAENYELNIGSKTFVDTFEEQLIGKNVGEELEVNVTFPESYGNENLKGKPALFKVKINEIKSKELPDLDDEFASEVSEFDTFAEYKESVKTELDKMVSENAERERENRVIKALVAQTEIDLPKVMIEGRVDQMVNDFAGQIEQQGIKLADYLNYMGQSIESLKGVYAKDAEEQVRGRLVLEAISKDLDVEVTEADLDKEIERIAAQYKMELDKFKNIIREEDKESLKEDLKTQKALEKVVSSAKEV
ncbi:MAG: trigger factor [Lachnospirales bacterium]